jgi:dipeptidyl aminopeptidase/acylaminoacyl peptidase
MEGARVNRWRLTVFQRTCRGGLGAPTESVQRRKEVSDYCAEAAKSHPFASWDIGIVARPMRSTSRGIGVLDVNHRGSTGYGRAYRLRLERQWGVVDVQDCVHGARYLIEERNADPARLIISGSSAGGYTTLRALTPEREKTFSGGASYYGVSDLAALARDTDKFESHYLDWLIGAYPQEQQTYADRSPAMLVLHSGLRF